MVKKLLKYDLIALMRVLLPIDCIVLGTALLARIVFFFENDSIPYKIVSVSSIVFYVISVMAICVMTVALCIIRFYKNLFSAEGYLTFTLPVTHRQIIFSKLIASLLAELLTIFVIVSSVAVMTSGEVLVEGVKAIFYLAKVFIQETGANSWVYLTEVIVMFFVLSVGAFLLFYSCIAIGQLARRARILLAFGVYFAYYFLTQLISTVLLVINVALDFRPMEWIAEMMEDHPFVMMHGIFCTEIVLAAILGVVYYAITYSIMKKKLNLE